MYYYLLILDTLNVKFKDNMNNILSKLYYNDNNNIQQNYFECVYLTFDALN